MAGLELDPVALMKLSGMVVRATFIPCFTEALAVAVFSVVILGLPWTVGFMLGFVLAAVSPAVIIPCLMSLASRYENCTPKKKNFFFFVKMKHFELFFTKKTLKIHKKTSKTILPGVMESRKVYQLWSSPLAQLMTWWPSVVLDFSLVLHSILELLCTNSFFMDP